MRFILAAGMALTGAAALIKELSGTVRGLVCWTLASLSLGLSAAVYFGSSGGFSVNEDSLAAGACGIGALAVLMLLIELAAPAKRFRRKKPMEYDSRAAEQSLNIVFVITAAALSCAACAADMLGAEFMTVLCIIPAAAISLRQLSYFLYCSKCDASGDRTEKQRRESLLKSLGRGDRGL